MFKYFSLFLILFSIQQKLIAQPVIKDGYDVIEAMFYTYENRWYDMLTFTQKTTFYGRGGEVQRVQTWYEALDLPGKLAIKFDEKNSDNGILFNEGIQYGYANGQKIQETTRIHELLVLGFDIYHQHPDTTANQLINLNYDLRKVYEDEWQGRPVYVVGVNEADSTIPQFWVDKEHLYFVRSLSKGRQNILQEVQFNDYKRIGEGWVAPTVIFKANGFTGLLEEYTDIAIPDSLNPAIFDPNKFTVADWD